MFHHPCAGEVCFLDLYSRQIAEFLASLISVKSHLNIVLRYMLPNMVPSVIVVATFAMATVIITEASLSFLGVGVPPAIPTWGSMLSKSRTYIHRAPWLAFYPGLAIFVTVLGINLLGDALRDIFDPRLRGEQ